MQYPAATKQHSAARVHKPNERRRRRVIRFAFSEDVMVCFGDGPMSDLPDRTRVFVDLTNTDGTLEAEFAATVHDISPDDVTPDALEVLVEHVPLGHTTEEIAASLERQRARRLVALRP